MHDRSFLVGHRLRKIRPDGVQSEKKIFLFHNREGLVLKIRIALQLPILLLTLVEPAYPTYHFLNFLPSPKLLHKPRHRLKNRNETHQPDSPMDGHLIALSSPLRRFPTRHPASGKTGTPSRGNRSFQTRGAKTRHNRATLNSATHNSAARRDPWTVVSTDPAPAGYQLRKRLHSSLRR